MATDHGTTHRWRVFSLAKSRAFPTLIWNPTLKNCGHTLALADSVSVTRFFFRRVNLINFAFNSFRSAVFNLAYNRISLLAECLASAAAFPSSRHSVYPSFFFSASLTRVRCSCLKRTSPSDFNPVSLRASAEYDEVPHSSESGYRRCLFISKHSVSLTDTCARTSLFRVSRVLHLPSASRFFFIHLLVLSAVYIFSGTYRETPQTGIAYVQSKG